ncbi:MAG: VWA domain-containing protein [Planctomycetes bacterium]|nr:VWA domain-containing protein [Planctomycetota bacterium]
MTLAELTTDSLPADTPRFRPLRSRPIQATARLIVTSWAVSLVLHGVALAVMFLVVFPYAPVEQRDPPAVLAEIVGDVDGMLAAPAPAPPAAAQAGATGTGSGVFASTQPYQPLAEITSDAPPSLGLGDMVVDRPGGLTLIGVGAGGGLGGEDFSQFGAGGGGIGGGAGRAEFFGLGGAVKGVSGIVYVVDRSGSMTDTFQKVREELRRSISALRRSQKFHVIFFNAGDPLENPPKKLVSAIDAQKKAFFEFLDAVMPEGSTHPERSMRRALALKPDLIYFLSDGGVDRGLLAKLDEWNRDRAVRIFTIAYFDQSGAALLEQIAREHGGEYKFVSENDLP